MNRRDFLAASAASFAASPLARSALAQGTARTLRFAPQGNLANPDPVWTTTTIARNHALMVWDCLYGWDESLVPQPQMAEGHTVSDDKLLWTITLRDGLVFHDGQPVRAADCVASILRWAKRRPLGQRMMQQAEGIRALDDKRIEVRLNKPFALLTHTLSDWCFMMPERTAKTDAYTQISEYVGSGPYKFVRDEWVSGSKALYVRNEAYVPRKEPPSFAAGGKVAHFDRVEWLIMPDKATEAAALRNGEVDWVEQPLNDLLPSLRQARGVRVVLNDNVGVEGMLALNHLHPPFNNPQIRKALLSVIDQRTFLEAAYGADPDLYKPGCGVFSPSSPMATGAGMEALTGPRDIPRAKKMVAEAGYDGTPVVLLSPSDYPVQLAFAQVARELMQEIGLKVDYVSTDWGTLVQRRASKEPPSKGGWNMFPTTYEGLTVSNPGSHVPLRGNGLAGWFGWPTDPEMEALRNQWFDAPDLAAQKAIAAKMQVLAFQHVPYIPLGQAFQPTAVRDSLTNLVKASFPIFWGVRKT